MLDVILPALYQREPLTENRLLIGEHIDMRGERVEFLVGHP
jgi:hypothetical protein